MNDPCLAQVLAYEVDSRLSCKDCALRKNGKCDNKSFWIKPHDGSTPKSNVFVCSACGGKVYSSFRIENKKETYCPYPYCPYCRTEMHF